VEKKQKNVAKNAVRGTDTLFQSLWDEMSTNPLLWFKNK
jgi:hypothetical protein